MARALATSFVRAFGFGLGSIGALIMAAHLSSLPWKENR